MLKFLPHKHRPCARLQQQRGVGLIEVLIAVLVLSIGMLGMAGLQSVSLRNSQSAHQRGMAIIHAYYIADIMRADRINAVNGVFDIELDDDVPGGAGFAATSIGGWRASLQDALGEDATGSIDCNGPVCQIVVRWDDSRGTDGANEQQILVEVEL